MPEAVYKTVPSSAVGGSAYAARSGDAPVQAYGTSMTQDRTSMVSRPERTLAANTAGQLAAAANAAALSAEEVEQLLRKAEGATTEEELRRARKKAAQVAEKERSYGFFSLHLKCNMNI